MTSQELADEVTAAVVACRSRVLGVGADQYDDGSGTQKFERMSVGELSLWMEEEIDDMIVYAVMVRIRLRRMMAVLEEM